jgi:hypothetical protein
LDEKEKKPRGKEIKCEACIAGINAAKAFPIIIKNVMASF